MSDPIPVTNIVRVSDGTPLCSGAEPSEQGADLRAYKQQLKKVVASLSKVRDKEALVSLGAGAYIMYVIESSFAVVALFVSNFPQGAAAAYLSELKKEFNVLYDDRVIASATPFKLMQFETFIEKTKRVFATDKKLQRDLQAVAGNLSEIHRVMTRSLSEVVSRGEDIGVLSQKTDIVLAESESYRKASVELNRMKWLQKYGMIAVIVIVLLFLLWYIRRKFLSLFYGE